MVCPPNTSLNFRVCAQRKIQQNTAIFYIYENPKLLFPFFILCYFIFSLMNALVYVDINKVVWNEKWKKQLWVFTYIKYGKFWRISLELFVEHTLWNWDEHYGMSDYVFCQFYSPKLKKNGVWLWASQSP